VCLLITTTQEINSILDRSFTAPKSAKPPDSMIKICYALRALNDSRHTKDPLPTAHTVKTTHGSNKGPLTHTARTTHGLNKGPCTPTSKTTHGPFTQPAKTAHRPINDRHSASRPISADLHRAADEQGKPERRQFTFG
jgi:hypothetical protein